MPALKLFVSHSSRLDDVNSELPADHNFKLLEETCALLKQEYGNKIEILVDQDNEHGLYPGCDWERRLNEWLAECHAAIILFSERARTKSNWVKKEATILSWRREIQENFTLIPVLLDGQTDPDDLEQDLFGTLRINKSQCIHHTHNAQEIVTGIKTKLGEHEFLNSFYTETPFERLESVIADLLEDGAKPKALERAWNALVSEEKPEWYPDCSTRFAHALTRYLFRQGKFCLANFQRIVEQLRPKPNQEKIEELLEYIRSLWVDPKAASRLPITKKSHQLAVMNGKHLATFTFARYIERAWPISNNYKIIFVTESYNLQVIQNQLRDRFQSRRRCEEIDPDTCDERINGYPRQILVHLPATETEGGGLLDDPRLRKQLGVIYPNIIFVLGTGDTLPLSIPSDILVVEPELDLQLEQQQLWEEENIDEFLDDYFGR